MFRVFGQQNKSIWTRLKFYNFQIDKYLKFQFIFMKIYRDLFEKNV